MATKRDGLQKQIDELRKQVEGLEKDELSEMRKFFKELPPSPYIPTPYRPPPQILVSYLSS